MQTRKEHYLAKMLGILEDGLDHLIAGRCGGDNMCASS